MHLKAKLFLSALLFTGMISTTTASAKGSSIEANANRESLYLEESLILSVKVSGADDKTEPDLSAIKDCDIKLLGSHAQNYSSTTWVNGKMTRTGFKGRLFSYNVTPRKTGRIRLGPIVVAHKGEVHSAEGPTVTVTGIEEQDDVVISVSTSRDTVLVDESFEVTLDIYIKCLDGPHQDIERLLGSRPPHLSVPFLTLTPMTGLKHTNVRTLLQNMITRRESKPAFTLNNYASRRDPFDFDSMFNFNEARRSTPDRFSFPVKKTVRNGDKCWHYQIQTQYVALEESTHTFGPVIFKGGIIETINASKQVSLKQVFAVGRSKNVRVVPPPEEDRPSSFVGAIGTNMIVDAALDAQNCRVGDPLTLTLTVSGGVNLKNIYAPDLSAQETLLKQFRLYEDTLATDRKTDSVSFSYTIRPTEAGTLEVPPISLSYFDSGARKYRTVRTSPIPVTAAEAGGIDSGMILGVDTNRQDALGQEQGGSLRYVAPFASHRSAAKDRGLGWHMAHLVLMLLSPAAFFTAMAARPALRVRRKLGKESERKGFYKDTVKALKKVSMLPADEASARIAALILSYVGRRSGENPNSLTPPDLSRLLDGSGLDDDSRSDLFRIASDHFNASFTHEARSKLDIREDAARAIEVITLLEDLRRQSGRSSIPLLIAILLTGFALTAVASNREESEFLWQKAWSKTISASTAEDYARAVQDYRELVAGGTRNKHIFYNMGTALLMAGDKESALRAFERAERYGGTDRRIMHNISLASSDSDDEPGTISWKRIVFFWHFALPVSIRTSVAVGAWTLLFTLLALGARNRGHVYRTIFGAVLFILIIFGSSALTSGLQEHRDRIRDTYASRQSLPEENTE